MAASIKETFHKRQRVSRQKSFNLLPGKAFTQIMYVFYIARNTKSLENISF